MESFHFLFKAKLNFGGSLIVAALLVVYSNIILSWGRNNICKSLLGWMVLYVLLLKCRVKL